MISIRLLKKRCVSLSVVLVCVSLIGCGDDSSKTTGSTTGSTQNSQVQQTGGGDNSEKTTAQTTDLQASNLQNNGQTTDSNMNPVSNSTAFVSTDYTLTDMTLSTLLRSVQLSVQANERLNKQQRQCVKDIDINFARQPVQQFFNRKFSPDELAELNKFYKSRTAINYTNYGRDQLLISSGLTVKKMSKRPTKSQLKKITEFANSPLGIKYKQVSQQTGNDSLSAIVKPLLKQELVKCGVQ